MQRKLVGYFLLSFLSFCFFTVVFNVLAIAHVSAEQPPSQIIQQVKLLPTPTIYAAPTITPRNQTNQNASLFSPTPTLSKTTQALKSSTQTHIVTVTQVPPTPTDIPTVAPTQAPQPTIATTTDLETLFGKYGSQYSVSVDELKKIANCESGFNSASDTGMYAGMFQFSAGTWASIRGAMGLDGNPELRKNSEEAIKTAAFMLARGEQNAWPSCH